MLTKDQAREIVQGSIKETVGRKTVSAANRLEDAGIITQQHLNVLIRTIAENPIVGVPRFEHTLDPHKIGELNLTITIEALTSKIQHLSAGKVCTNPKTPHPQKCCPYPKICPQCGYPV